MTRAEIRVNLDKKCKKCGDGGATQNGLCLDCIVKGLHDANSDRHLSIKTDGNRKMSGQNIPLAAYLSRIYSGQVQEVFKENKWSVTDVMKAGLELFLSCPKSLQDELVKSQTGQKDHVSIDDLVTVMRAMPGKVKPRYNIQDVQQERGPRINKVE